MSRKYDFKEGTNENWYALCLAIIAKFSSNKAIKYYKLNYQNRKWSASDVRKMFDLKQSGMKCKQIADIFNITRSQAKAVIQYYSKKFTG